MVTDLNEPVFFCSAASRYSQEMLAASAAHYKSYILVEHTHPFPGSIREALVDKAWMAGLQRLAQKVNAKILLIRNQQSDYKQARLIYVDCIRKQYFTIISNYERLKDVSLEEKILAADTLWEDTAFFTICTNGKKDKCCAKFGFPVFKFFENCQTDVPVWECSHVGGDRFAANAVLMPYGIYYGRIGVEDVEPILQHLDQRKIYPTNYRGLSRLSFFEQAVEVYMRRHLNNYDFDFSLQIRNRRQHNNMINVEVVTFNDCMYDMQLKREVIDYPHLLTCHSQKREPVVKYLLRSITLKQ